MNDHGGLAFLRIIGKPFKVSYRDGKDEIVTVEGELVSLDEQGFVVLEKNGNKILVKKDLVETMEQCLKGE